MLWVKIYEYICTMSYLVKYKKYRVIGQYVGMYTMTHLWSFSSLWAGSTLRSCWASVSFSSLGYKERNTLSKITYIHINHIYACMTYIQVYGCILQTYCESLGSGNASVSFRTKGTLDIHMQ